MTHRSHRLGLAVLVVAATMPMASAAPYTWTTSGSGSVFTDGPGTWNTSALNWTTTGAGAAVAWPNQTTDIAVFGANSGAAGTVTVGAVSTNGITFKQPGSGSYLLSGGTIAFGGTNPTISTRSGVSAAIASSATSASGLITGGSGILTMSGSVRLASAGTFTVGDGEVVVANGGALSNAQAFSVGTNVVGGTATLRIQSGGSLSVSGNNQNSTIGTTSVPWATVIQEGGSVTISGTPGTFGSVVLGQGATTTYSGSSSYSMQGGSLTLSNTNGGFLSVGRNAPATFTQSGGTVTLGRTSDVLILGDYSSGSYEMSGGSLTASSTSANAILGNRGGTGTLTITNSGSFGIAGSMFLAVNGSNSATDKGSATINLQGGDLAVNGMTLGRTTGSGPTGSNGPGTATFNFSGGTLRPFSANTSIGSASGTSNFSISLSGTGATLSGIDRATAASRTLDVYATLDGTGNVTVSGGLVNLRGTNTYTGATTIASGTLMTGIANAISGSSAITIGGATTRGFLEIDHALTISSLTFTGSGGDVSSLSTGTATLSAASGTATINVLSGSNAFHAAATLSSPTVVNVENGAFFSFHNNLFGGGSLTKSGSGTMLITGDNDQLSGNLFVTGGRLNVGSGMTQIGTGTTTVSGGATLDLNGHSFGNTINVISGTLLNQAVNTATTTITGVTTVSGSTAGVYNVNGGGVATFASTLGAGTSTLDVNVNSGGQAIFSAAVESLADVVVNSGGQATFAAAVNTGVFTHVSSTTRFDSTGTQTVSGALNGPGAVIKQGAGLLVLTATNTNFSGDVTVSSGTIQVGNGQALGTGALALQSGGLDLNGNTLSIGTLSGSSASSVSSGVAGAAKLISTATGDSTFAGVIANGEGTVAFEKAGVGRLTFTDAQTYTGNTIISGGTLALAANGSFANAGAIIVGDAGSSGAVFDLTGKTNVSIGSAQTLMGKGTVLFGENTDVTINGLLSPGNSPGLLTWSGSGSVTLSGTTLMEVWGTSRGTTYDAIDLVNGTDLTFGGLLQLNFDQLFDNGTTFNLFTPDLSSSLAGTFSSITMVGSSYGDLTFTNNAGFWTTNTGANNQSMSFNSATGTLSIIVVPEPAGIALAGIGIAAVAYRVLRRRT